MKKKVFITLCIIAASFAMPAIAQNSELDAFIKKHSNDEKASYVEMAKPMLDAAFAQYKNKDFVYPKSFKSLVMFDNNHYDELKQKLSKYEILMVSRTKNGDEHAYYYLPFGDGAKEIVVIQVQKVSVVRVKKSVEDSGKVASAAVSPFTSTVRAKKTGEDTEYMYQLSITHMVSDEGLDLTRINAYLSKIRHSLMGADAASFGGMPAFGSRYQFDYDHNILRGEYDKIREQVDEIKRMYIPDAKGEIRIESGKNGLYIGGNLGGQKIDTSFPEIVIPEIDLSDIKFRKDSTKTNIY